MTKMLFAGLALVSSSVALCSTSTITIVPESYNQVAPNATVSGYAGGSSGVRDNQDGTYSNFGTTTYSFSKTNTTGVTQAGYVVKTTATNPTYPNVSYYDNPATVSWLTPKPADPTPVGPGE